MSRALRLIDPETPPDPDLHLVPDKCATHKHPKVRAWLARRPRFHLCFTPASASRLNQAGRWFAIISRRAIKRGSFNSTAQRGRTIERFIKDCNGTASPFVRVATADSIFSRIERLTV